MPRTIPSTLAAAALLVLTACSSGQADAGAAAPSAITFIAYDMGYDPMEATVSAGSVEVTLVNEGAAVHNIVIEELDDLNITEARSGETDTGAVTLEPGTYTIYCDIPGHRSAGMDRTLTVR